MLYQTREVSPDVWARDMWKFRRRVYELVGVSFDKDDRPTSEKYLGLLDVIERLTVTGTMKDVVLEYFRIGKDAEA